MNDLLKTTIFAGVALVLAGPGLLHDARSPAGEVRPISTTRAKPFFPDFKDPLACTDLEVVDFDSVDGHGIAISRDVQG